MSSNSSTATRVPGRRGRQASKETSRSKPSSARYLYDDNDNISTQSLGDSVSDFSSLGGFSMALTEDDRSELTCKANNLSSVRYGRKFPKHHSGYQRYQEHQWQQQKRVRFQLQDDESTPMSVLTEDAIYAHYNNSMTFNNATIISDDESDAEYPTNVSHSTETRSTADLSFDEEIEQVRLIVHGDSLTNGDHEDIEIDSIGVIAQVKRPLPLRCLPSIGNMSRWFFLTGCVLTLWMAIDSLSWAKQQHASNQSSTLLASHTRLRKLSGKTIGIMTHQDQWDDNSQWAQLQQEEQDSWSNLGFTEKQWDNHEGVSTDNIDWDQLTQDQIDAAEELGFTKPVWDHYHMPETEETSETIGRGNDQLPKQEAATTESSESSNSNPPPTSETNPPAAAPATTSSSTTSKEKDPVIFTTAGLDVPVTKYMVLSFAAALCFTMVGIMEWIQHDFFFQLLLAISGVWGLLSAILLKRNPGASLAFHTLSVHCFLAASAAILWLRFRQPAMPAHSRAGRVAHRTQEEALLLADLCFAVGSGMMVVSSYLKLSYGAEKAALLVDIQRFDVFAAILWVACAVVYLICAYKASTQEVR